MNSPYFYRPQPSMKRAADDVFLHINSNHLWQKLFSHGKMLGILIYSREPFKYLVAYSGVINGLEDPEHYFVPPIYNLQDPDDFYLQKDAEITAINHRIDTLQRQTDNHPDKNFDSKQLLLQIADLKSLRKTLSNQLQLEIFSQFNVLNTKGQYKNIAQIFEDTRHRLPPGGTGECAAPRLLQYAFQNHLQPLEIAEFWFGASPKVTLRVHGQFYPSCIEKCSPLLKYMTEGVPCEQPNDSEQPSPIQNIEIVYEDEHLLVLDKPAESLSVPGKMQADSIESKLHELYPTVKGPMLIHRLDQSTSGLMIAAKDADTHKKLQQEFESREVHKAYLAWVEGTVISQCGVINLPICPNPDERPRQIVDFVFGKKAVTFFEVLDRREDATLLRFSPLTGRTHQLRLHSASIFGLGHAIIGDRIYLGRAFSRLQLHAQSITFTHPITQQMIRIESSNYLKYNIT